MNNSAEMVLRKDKHTKLSTLLYSNDNNNLNECDDNNERESREIPAAYEISQQVSAAAFANLSPVSSPALSHSIPLSKSKRQAMLLGPSSARTIPKTEVDRETGPGVEASGSIGISCTSNNNNSSNNSNNSSNTSRKVFECDVCNMIFSNGANMRRHRMRHTGVKPYECRICQKRFFRKDHLAEHFTTHTKTLPFHCPICDRGFQRQIAMRAHFQNEHVGQHDLVKSCPLCAYHASSMKGLRVHFFNRHGVDLDNPGPHSSLLTPATTSLNTGTHLIRSSISSIADQKGLLDSLANDNSNTSTISNPNSVNMSSLNGTNYQLSVFSGNNINNNYNNDNNNDEEDDDDDDDGDGDGEGDVEGEGVGERDADDDDGDVDSNLMSSKMALNRSGGTDSVSITLSKAVALSESQTHSDSGDSNYGVSGSSKGTLKSSSHRIKRENKERRSMENATPPMHFLTPQVEISMASDDIEIHNTDNQYNDLDNYQDNDQDHEHDNENDHGNDTSNGTAANSNGNPERSQQNQSNKFKNRLKIASSSSSPSPSLFLQQILADQSNPTINEHATAATSTSSTISNTNNLNNASIIPSISLIPIKQEAIGCMEDNSDTAQTVAKTFVSNCSTSVTVTLSAAAPTASTTTAAMITATATAALPSSCGDTIRKQLSPAITATAMASHPVSALTAAIASTTSTSSTAAVSISPLFSFIHTTSTNSGSGGSVGVRDANQSSSLSSLMKVSPLKSLLKDELKRKPSACSVNTTSRTVNMYSGGGAIGQSNNQTMIVWPNFSKTKTLESTTQPHNLQQAITEMKCLYCGIFFPDQTLYFLHIGCHSESNPWKCNICGEQCSNIYEFNSHLLSKSH